MGDFLCRKSKDTSFNGRNREDTRTNRVKLTFLDAIDPIGFRLNKAIYSNLDNFYQFKSNFYNDRLIYSHQVPMHRDIIATAKAIETAIEIAARNAKSAYAD